MADEQNKTTQPANEVPPKPAEPQNREIRGGQDWDPATKQMIDRPTKGNK